LSRNDEARLMFDDFDPLSRTSTVNGGVTSSTVTSDPSQQHQQQFDDQFELLGGFESTSVNDYNYPSTTTTSTLRDLDVGERKAEDERVATGTKWTEVRNSL